VDFEIMGFGSSVSFGNMPALGVLLFMGSFELP